MCKAQDEFSSFLGRNYGIGLRKAPKSYTVVFPYYLVMFSAKCGVSMSNSDVTVTQYLNIPNFRPEKFFWPPEGKRPRVGSGHYKLAMAHGIG